MKNFTVFAVVALLIFILSSIANAWTVTIVNNSPETMKCEIKGEHLFWVQTDCTTVVDAKSTGSCEMPGGICPSGGHFEYGGITHDFPRGGYVLEFCINHIHGPR